MIWTNKKAFIFRQKKCTVNVLYPSLSKWLLLSIYILNPMETQPCAIFARVITAKWIAGCNHGYSLEDDYCVPFFRLKCFIPTLRHILYDTNNSDIYRECDFLSSVLEDKLGKHTFLWVSKKTFIANGRKIKVNSFKKYVKFFSSEYYFPSDIAPLILLAEYTQSKKNQSIQLWFCQ